MAHTPAQAMTLFIFPKITFSISLIASLFMIIDILRSSKKLASSYHRIILGMTICVLLSWASIVVGDWNWGFETDNNGPINKPLCMMNRFLSIFYVSAVMYNVILSIYYFLVVKCNWSKARIRNIEPWLHIFAIGWGLTAASIVVILAEANGEFDAGLCIKINEVSIYVYMIPMWLAIIAVTVLNLIVYWKIRTQERLNERYRFNTRQGERPSRKLSRRAKKQGILYVCPFYVTLIPWTISLTYIFYEETGYGDFAAYLTVAICGPLQGFFNFLVYITPRYLKYRKSRPESSFLQVIGQTLRRTLCFRNVHQDSDEPESSFLQVIGQTLRRTLCFRNVHQDSDDQHSSESDDKSEDGSHIEHGGRRTLASATNSTEPLLVQVDD
eukprot:CAMPEP_0195539374 /NCGR_PEP_ID=MMETSP0794_2-20130614/50019_1 /TAXON_ID=515487 /ORGANISM="Stephanopyxis turris, Strain CCMP 815" /LENGTH=383 /DNA_ID=CAMNT_0040673399 /DNA_START=100 /DNA_END=1251 /DNA_ORIENTATION=+